jgi:hypothetical protein
VNCLVGQPGQFTEQVMATHTAWGKQHLKIEAYHWVLAFGTDELDPGDPEVAGLADQTVHRRDAQGPVAVVAEHVALGVCATARADLALRPVGDQLERRHHAPYGAKDAKGRTRQHKAPTTFIAHDDAVTWLKGEEKLISWGA